MGQAAKNRRVFKQRVFRLMPKVVCYICEKELKEQKATIDHFIPKKWKGPDKPRNYEIACHRCNEDKGCKMPNDEIKQQRLKNRLPDSIRYGT